MALIAPSLLAANFAQLAEALQTIKGAGASMVHVDVMDGHFVPDITVGQPVIQSLRKATDLVLDIHLLVERPERFTRDFLEAGADRLSVHAEATPNLHRTLEEIRGRGAKAGLALNPSTPLEAANDVLEDIDFLLLLSSDMGFGEESFIPHTITKVREAAAIRDHCRLSFAVQVEGGIQPAQVEELVRAGADILVAGSAIFHKDDPKRRLAEMIRVASVARQISRV